MLRNSYTFSNVYLDNWACVTGNKEYLGNYGSMVDKHFNDLYFNNKTFEKAEISMIKQVIEILLRKSKNKEEDISLMVGGDLSSQLVVSNYAMRNFNIPFMAVYAACSTITLAFIISAMYLENTFNINKKSKVIAFASSHNGVCERTFRYPNEYGTQRADSYTTTVTAANCFLLSNEVSRIKLTKITIGKVIDSTLNDFQDMGRAMAPAAYNTILEHFTEFKCDYNEYDLIITGDLSYYGSMMLKEMFKIDGIDFNVIKDSGLLVYDRNKQNVWAGGSGAGCIGIMLTSEIFPMMLKGKYKKVLVCATGALLNSTMLAQKEKIPAICHAVAFEVI